MKYESLNQELKSALEALDVALVRKDVALMVLLGGASGMKIAGIITRDSRDLDSFRAISGDVKEIIAEIAARHNMEPDWLNDQPSDIPLPDGAESRFQELQTAFKKIEISVIGRQDLITLKLNAAINRAESRDIEDVNSAHITLEEFEEAVRYILQKNRAEEKVFQDYQDNDIAELRRELFG